MRASRWWSDDEPRRTLAGPPAGAPSRAYVRPRRRRALPPPLATVGWLGWMRARICSAARSTRSDDRHRVALVGWSCRRWSISCSSTRSGAARPRGLPASAARPEVGACWAFIRERFAYIDLRLLSDRPALAGRPVLRPARRSAPPGCCGFGAAPRARRALFLRRAAGRVVRAAARRAGARPAACVDTALWGGMLVTIVVAAVGIVVSLPLGILLALGRRSRDAGGAAVVDRLHRVRARRAADHRAVHGERDAAAVRAGSVVARQAAARAGRRRAVLVGLYGRGGARPACRRSRRASTRRPRRSAWATGAVAALIILPQALGHDPGHRQHLHRAVQGHDAGVHRRHFRLPQDRSRWRAPIPNGRRRSRARPATPSRRWSISCSVSRMSRYAARIERRLAVGDRR